MHIEPSEANHESTPITHHVYTLLTPGEQERVDAAARGCFDTTHRESLDQVLTDLRSRSATAILLSVARMQQGPPQQAAIMARVVREFPRIPAVGLLTGVESHPTHTLFTMGQQGVRALVDVRDPAGWRDLRALVVRQETGTIEAEAMRQLRELLPNARPECLRFLDTLFLVSTRLTTIRALASRLHLHPTTFMSRFTRLGLPTPKRYLAYARLVRAASRLENPGVSLTQVAFQLEFSSPQSFSRHVQSVLGISAAAFRRRHTGQSMLRLMLEELVRPYREALVTFDPFATQPQWLVQPAPRISRQRTTGRMRQVEPTRLPQATPPATPMAPVESPRWRPRAAATGSSGRPRSRGGTARPPSWLPRAA